MTQTLFLSTVTSEFGGVGGVRTRLARLVERTKSVPVLHQADFVNRGVVTLHALEEEVRRSAFVVHLIGAEPGWAPPPDQARAFLCRHPGFAVKFPDIAAVAETLSATQWEAWMALYFDKRLYAYELPARLAPESSQRLHSERLRRLGHFPKAADDEDGLFDEVVGSLIECGLLTRAEAERKVAPSRILRHSPPRLFGRDRELDALDAAWADREGVNVYTLVAWGGVGKTSLVAHWVANRLKGDGRRDVERYFDWSFYSQGTGESRQTSSDLFINAALKFFGDPDPVEGGPWERGERLAGLVRRHRTLLVLDGLEPLQYPVNDPSGQAGRLKDLGLEALVQGLAQENPGLCVITTHERLTNVESFDAAKGAKLDRLPKEAAVALLRHLQIVGTDQELEAAWKDAGGHALTLQLLGRFLADAHGGDIRLRGQVHFDEMDAERQGRSAFKVMAAYESWLASAGPERRRELALLRLTGLFDRPMAPDCLAALRVGPAIPGLTDLLVGLKDSQWNIGVNRLLSIDLVSQAVAADATGGKYQPHLSIDAHPLIREYFALQLKRELPAAFAAAHSRLFDHLCASTPHRPDTLEGLGPLYQAVVHGCLANRRGEALAEVYQNRILRPNGHVGNFSIQQLGAVASDLAAIATFFEEPWSRVSPELDRGEAAYVYNTTATYLKMAGRLTESLGPLRTGLQMASADEEWDNASAAAGTLSELNVLMCDLKGAVAAGRLAVDFADKAGDDISKTAALTILGDALHSVGEVRDAWTAFRQAERLQSEWESQTEFLYSLQGFKFCELIVRASEKAVWKKWIGFADPFAGQESEAIYSPLYQAKTRTKSSQRFWHRIAINPQSKYEEALDLLMLAHIRNLDSMRLLAGPRLGFKNELAERAMADLRSAGVTYFWPLGLIVLAVGAHLRGDDSGAVQALREAQQIAQRGPMPLHLADVHLHRARLFRDRAELLKAAKLIGDLGYGRRYGELADAEEAAKLW